MKTRTIRYDGKDITFVHWKQDWWAYANAISQAGGYKTTYLGTSIQEKLDSGYLRANGEDKSRIRAALGVHRTGKWMVMINVEGIAEMANNVSYTYTKKFLSGLAVLARNEFKPLDVTMPVQPKDQTNGEGQWRGPRAAAMGSLIGTNKEILVVLRDMLAELKKWS